MISIIIPIYNAEGTLTKCVNSVLHQTYTDWELILVDDGSTDQSGTLCNVFESKDKRIKVHHQSNGGPSKARNAGINMAQGEWITFIDADDWVEKKYIADFFEYDRNSNILYTQNILRCSVNDMPIQDSRDFFFSPVSKLYYLSLIKQHNVHFLTNINFGEDALFNIDYCEFITKIERLNAYNYHYIDNLHSLSKNISCDVLYRGILEFKKRINRNYIIENSYYRNFVSLKIMMRYELLFEKLYKEYLIKYRLQYLKKLFPNKISVVQYYPTSYKMDNYIKYLLKKKQYILADIILNWMYYLRKVIR